MKKEKVIAFYLEWIDALDNIEAIEQLIDNSLESIYNEDEKIIIAYDETDGLLILDPENLDRHYPHVFHMVLKSTHDTSSHHIINEIAERIEDLHVRLASQLELKEDEYGYKIDVKNLEVWRIETIVKMMHDKLMKTWTEKNHVNIELYYEDSQLDYYVMFISEGVEGLTNKLNEWAATRPHYTVSLDDGEAMEYIEKRIIDSFLITEYEEWLREYIEDIHEDDIYYDVSLEEVVNFMLSAFYNAFGETSEYTIDKGLEANFSYYGTWTIALVDDMYYLIMND